MKTMARPALALWLTLCLGFAPVLAAPAAAAQVSGRIFQADLSRPASGLSVTATPEGAKEPVASTVTNDDGRFRFASLPAGDYLIIFQNEGGQALAASKVSAVAGEKQSVTLALPAIAPGETATPEGEENKKRRGLWAWISTPAGAVLTAVVAAVVIGVAVDQATDDDEDEPDLSPQQPS